ncbi:MAG: TonB-dependent receptor [Cytophagaceae bacterium]
MGKIILLLLMVCPAFAQTDTIFSRGCNISLKGKVYDGETEVALENAVVKLEGVGTVMSDEKGRFVIKNICKGTYNLTIEFLGYKTLHTNIFLESNKVHDFVLHEEICELPSIVVEGKRFRYSTPLPQSILEGRQLDKTRGLSLGEAMQEIPGVYVLQTGPTIFKPVIQGLHGNRILIFNNGIRQEGQQWGYEHAPEIDPFVASRITLIKGANSVRYGSDAIGGVILVEPPKLRKEPGINGEVNLAGFSNNLMGAGSVSMDFAPGFIKGLSGRVQGSLRDAGNSSAPDYFISNTAFREHNYSWSLGYENEKFGTEVYYSTFTTKLGIFQGAHIGNLTDLQNAIASDRPLIMDGFSRSIDRPYQDITHELFKVSGFYNSRFGRVLVDYGRQYNDRSEYDSHRPRGDEQTDDPELRFRITTHTGNIVLEHKPVGRLTGNLGVNGIVQSNTWQGRFFIPNFQSHGAGIFLIERWKTNRLELEAGARYDVKSMTVYLREGDEVLSPEYFFSNFSGTAGAIYKLTPNWKLRGNAGTAFRPPAVNELFSRGVHHGTASVEIGDPNLLPEVAYNTTLSAEFAYQRIYGEMSVFSNYIHNFIYLAPVMPPTLTIRGAFPTFHYRQTNALFTGFDFTLNDSISANFILSTRFSWIRGYNTTENDYLIWIPPVRWENGVRYRINHKIGSFNDVFAELRHTWVGRQNRVPEDSDYAPPPPAYMLFHLEMGGVLKAGVVPVFLSLSVNNLLNTRYRDYLDRFRYFTDAMGRNIMLRVRVPLGKSV